MEVYEANAEVVAFLKSQNILAQYKKAKEQIKNQQYKIALLKKREPKKDGIYQFRITRKYRAFAIRKENRLIVFSISDHQ